jgi:hypothetical protein
MKTYLRKNLEGYIFGFHIFLATFPLGLHPLLPMKRGTIPSWVCTPENPKR